jgi:lipopolysaccharide/colanic/teichoic acid biosynthesis glycosyltransferase
MGEKALSYPISESHKKTKVLEIKDPFFKRPLDFFLSTMGLIISLPLWAATAIAIKFEDGGPVFYPQERWGKQGSKIKVFKFRTMVPDADKKWGYLQASENDPRITKVGRLLRTIALDELPQLFNIWKGDMSFVGPRALPINEVQIREKDKDLTDDAIPGFEQRLKVRPGLTGIAQIYAPRDVNRRNKFRYDTFYIKKMGLLLDIKLILLSLWITMTGKWENREKKI